MDISEVVSELNELLGQATGADEEQRIISLLRSLEGADFGRAIAGVSLERMLSALDWRVWGPDVRADFLQMLERRAGDLDLDTKVHLINLLAQGKTSLGEEKVIAALFMSETGQRLTELKLKVDTSSQGHDLLGTVTGDIDSAELRTAIVEHFRISAVLPEDPSKRLVRVVSDIDDTLYSSLNDPRYPKGTLYKGVLELFGGVSDLPPVFLTARPELVAAMFERVTHWQLRKYGLETPTVLSGSLHGLMGHERMAAQKAKNLTSYAALYPEFRFVFFGDSGQGDMALSETLLVAKSPIIERAFIHKLSDQHRGAQTSRPDIHLFNDYAEAAERVFELGYINADQRDKVISLVRSVPDPKPPAKAIG